jgi:hypothetical protein
VDGHTLTVDNGTWTGTPAIGFAYQWRRCDALGASCADVAGATGPTYGLQPADVDHTLRVRVTARNATSSATVESDPTDVVTATGGTTTVTTTVRGNRAPTIRFLSLRIRSNRVYIRFRVCQSGTGKVTITERDQLSRRLAYTRRWSVRPIGCATYARTFSLIARFRAHGTYTVTLRALDASRRVSTTVRRSLRR